MTDKQCTMCGGTIPGSSCQSICSKCYSDFFIQNYPHELGSDAEHLQRQHTGDSIDPTDI